MNKDLFPIKKTINKKTKISNDSDGFLFGALIEGDVEVLIKNKTYEMKNGEFILFKPNEKTELSSTNKAEFIFLSISKDSLIKLSNDEFDFIEKFSFVPYDIALIHIETKQFLTIKNILNRMMSIGDDDFIFGLDIYQNSLYTCLLVLLLRACILSDDVHRKNSRKQLMIDNVYLYIKNNISDNLSLRQLESLFNVSGEHLSRKFKKEIGMSIHEYIVKTRIDLSKKYILEDKSIREICELTGFNSYNHFFKVFKKYVGLTPSEFLKQYK